MPNRLSRLALMLSLSLATSTGSFANESVLEEVLVSAQKRQENAQDIPLSITTIDANTIQESDLSTLEELSSHVPGLNINGGASQPNLFVRGVGSGLNIGFEQSVGIFSDDIYLGRAQFVRAPLAMDVQQVEFIYGPQGSIMGKNTTAGALNIRSTQPSQETQGYVSILVEPTHGEQSLNGAVSTPLSPNLSARLAFRIRKMDGYWTNAHLSADGPNNDNSVVRGSLRWENHNDLDIQLTLERGILHTSNSPVIIYQSDAGLNFQGNTIFPIISSNNQGADDLATTDDTGYNIVSLRAAKDLSNIRVSFISGFAHYQTERLESVDFSPQPAIHRSRYERFSQWSQELRLQSTGDSRLQWLGGAYYHQQDLRAQRHSTETDFLLLGDLSTPAIFEPENATTSGLFDQQSKSLSMFAQLDYLLTDTLSMSAGLRYTKEDKAALKVQQSNGSMARLVTNSFNQPEVLVFTDGNGVLIDDLRSHNFPELTLKEDDLSWNLSLQWQREKLLVYAAANTAFKGGGFDEAYGGPDGELSIADPLTGVATGETIATGISSSTIAYSSEKALSFELGSKWRFAHDRAELRAAVFYSNYDDLQTSALDVDQFVVVNAAKAISQGLEASGRFLIAKRWVLNTSLSLLDAKWDNFNNAPCTVAQTTSPLFNPGCLDIDGLQISDSSVAIGQDLTGETLLFAPKFSANISLSYLRGLTDKVALFSRLAINHKGRYYSSLDLDPNTQHDATTVVNLLVGLAGTNQRWRTSIIAKNLGNVHTTVVNGDVPTTASNSFFGIPQRGRSLALQLHFKL